MSYIYVQDKAAPLLTVALDSAAASEDEFLGADQLALAKTKILDALAGVAEATAEIFLEKKTDTADGRKVSSERSNERNSDEASEDQDHAGHWLIGGSGGLLLRDMPLTALPSDLDVFCDEPYMLAIHEALQAYASNAPYVLQDLFAISTLSSYRVQDQDVELIAGFEIQTAEGNHYVTQVERLLRPYAKYVQHNGQTIGIVPLAHEWIFNVLRERPDRVRLIEAAMLAAPEEHLPALAKLYEASDWFASIREQAEALLRKNEKR
jgi:hypothetical protein